MAGLANPKFGLDGGGRLVADQALQLQDRMNRGGFRIESILKNGLPVDSSSVSSGPLFSNLRFCSIVPPSRYLVDITLN